MVDNHFDIISKPAQLRVAAVRLFVMNSSTPQTIPWQGWHRWQLHHIVTIQPDVLLNNPPRP